MRARELTGLAGGLRIAENVSGIRMGIRIRPVH